MSSIASTQEYKVLACRYFNLLELFGTVSELHLHTNSAVNKITAKYYKSIYESYPYFFVPVMKASRAYFYIALRAYIGAYYDKDADKVIYTKNDAASLGAYLNNNKRVKRKKASKDIFEKFVKKYHSEINILHDIRHALAHYEPAKTMHGLEIFSEQKCIEILNCLADVIHRLGYRRGNSPHYFIYNNNSATNVQSIIDSASNGNTLTATVRKLYDLERTRWIGDE